MTRQATTHDSFGCWLRSSRAELLALALIILVGAALRFAHLGTQSLWLDEAASVHRATGSFGRMLRLVREAEETPPLYFIVQRASLAVGTSEAIVRLPSALFGIVAIPLIYLFGRALLGPAVGILSALLLALSPFHLYLSQEARSYALFVLLALASCYTLLLALERPRRLRWLVYGCVNVLLVYTHYFAFLLILTHGVLVLSLGRYRARGVRPWVLSQVVVLLLFLPWSPAVLLRLSQKSSTGGQVWIPQVGILQIPYTFFHYSLGYSGAKVRDVADVWQHAPLLVVALIAFGLPFVASLAAARRRPIAARWTWLVIAVPIATAYAVNSVVRCYQPMYLSFVMPLYVVVLAWGIVTLSRKPVALAPAAVIVPLVAMCLWGYYAKSEFAKEDWRGVASYVRANAGPDDIVVFHKSWLWVPFYHYYTGPMPRWILPDRALPGDSRELRRARHAIEQHSAAWLILAHNKDTGSHYADLLARWYPETEKRSFETYRTINVIRFDTKTSGAAQAPE